MIAKADTGEDAMSSLRHSSAYAGLISELRGLQDAVVAPGCCTETLLDVAKVMAELTARLGKPSEPDDIWRRILDPLPSRGRAMCPPLMISELTADFVAGTVVFGHHFLGRNGAAHGGAVAMLFDELFGGLINRMDGFRARTAFLHIDYKRITPIGSQLKAEASIRWQAGRKYFVCGQITCGDDICASAEALFIALKSGQI